MPNIEPKPRDRLVSIDSFKPEEYDAEVHFEGWEAEDGSGHHGFIITVYDDAYDQSVTHRFHVEY